MEIWKDINGYKGSYMISSKGRVKSLERTILMKNGKLRTIKEKIRVPVKDKDGYLEVMLSKNNITSHAKIHRLVAYAFLERIKGKNEVNHKDGNKANNSIENLEWCNALENRVHAVKNRLLRVIGSENPMSKLTEKEVKEIRYLYTHDKKNNSILKLAKKYNVCFQQIYNIIAWKEWKYVNM